MPANLASSVPETKPYYITIGLAELESTAPRDDQGPSDHIYAYMRRRDTVVEASIEDRLDRRRRIESRLRQLSKERQALTGVDETAEFLRRLESESRRAGARARSRLGVSEELEVPSNAGTNTEVSEDQKAIDAQIRGAVEERDRISAEVDELEQLVSGETPTLSRQGINLFFNDWPMPFRVYAADTVEVIIAEQDPFQDDKLGHTKFVIDTATLESGHLKLRTGWVQSLALGFTPCD